MPLPDAFVGLVHPRWRNGTNRVAPPPPILYTGSRDVWVALGSPGAFRGLDVARTCSRAAYWVLCVADTFPDYPNAFAVALHDADAVSEARARVAALGKCGVVVVRERHGAARDVLSSAKWSTQLSTTHTDTVVPPNYDSIAKINALLTAVGIDTHAEALTFSQSEKFVRSEIHKCDIGMKQNEIEWRNSLNSITPPPYCNDEPKLEPKSSFFLNMLQD